MKISTRTAPPIAGPTIAWIGVFVGCAILAQSAVAQEAAVAHGESAAQVYAAEKWMHAGDFSAAVDAYRVLADPSDTSTYNYGIALYRTGQIEQAAEKFRSLRAAPQTSLAGRARFNLGNTHYARALAAIEPSGEAGETDQAGQGMAGQPELDTAITQLQEAIGHYRSSLRVTPADNDARANIELAQRLIRQLRDQQEQQQDKEDKQQKQEQQEKDQEPQQQENEEQNQDGEQPDKQEQSSDSQDPSNESQEESESPEADENDSGEQDEQSSDDSQQESSEDQSGKPGDSNPQPGEEAGEKDGEKDGETETGDEMESPSATEPPPTPEGELTAENEDSDEEKGDESTREIVPLEPGKLTPEEARKLLQSIRDRDMLRRYERQMLERSRRVPVDRDW